MSSFPVLAFFEEQHLKHCIQNEHNHGNYVHFQTSDFKQEKYNQLFF